MASTKSLFKMIFLLGMAGGSGLDLLNVMYICLSGAAEGHVTMMAAGIPLFAGSSLPGREAHT